MNAPGQMTLPLPGAGTPGGERRGAARAQTAAADPGASSWVAANAGSGKTRVLIDRVARLLLAGCQPARILCLTYTKAAAAEMQTRLFDRLGQWAMLEDGALAAELAALGEAPAALTPGRLARARTLFAGALETPGGLKIQTIHAFCDTLLRRFPLEAGAAPGFVVMEDRQAKALREAALEAVALEAPTALERFARYLPGDDPDAVLREIAAERARFGRADFAPRLARAFGVAPGLTVAELAAEVFAPGADALLGELAAVLETGGVSDRRAAASIAAARAGDFDERLAQLESCLLHGRGATKNAPFTARTGSFPTRAARAALGPLAAALDDLMARVEAARPRRLGIAALEAGVALGGFARAWLARYDGMKAARGLLDFDDLIARAVALLADPETAAFVLWRLDGGLDHVLVDEAQDTSPAQWRVIRALTDEFFAGQGARESRRTVFVVGDEKQSIYSFQGADPAAFAEMRCHFEERLAGMEDELRRCDLLHSFRSARPVLRLVDAVFAGPAGADLAAPVAHLPVETAPPGRVELWPFIEKDPKAEEPPWDRPLDLAMPDDPQERLAAGLAAEIRGWLDAGTLVPDHAGPRPIRPDDVLVLVQRRSAVFHPIIRALKRARVPVAGADVLRIGGELAVKDLLAALRVAVTPADDLSLAALLRSPLGGLGERELFSLAHGRTGRLSAALAASSHAAAAGFVADLAAQADFLRPYELLERVLLRHDGRRRLVARLGAEAEDGIDALLDQAIAYESAEPPSVTGFLAWMTRGEVAVRRRSDDGAGEVRVMTVHGAKGLEAPVVILPDTARRQEGGRRPCILPLADTRADDLAAWALPADRAPPALAAAEAARRERQRAENRRLLYVALTRARSRLIVCGAGASGKAEEESWYRLVEGAMERLGAGIEAGGRRVIADPDWPEGTGGPAAAAAPPPAPPAWARTGAPPAPERTRPLSPSGLGGAHALPGEGDETAAALARGTAIHLLLDGLAGRPAGERAALAARLLPGAADLAAFLAEVEAVLDAPELAPLFGPDALAEVDIAAPLAALGGARILGRIDRLVVAPGRVLAADFKTNRVLPDRPEHVPGALLRQMGAYAAALAAIYPDREIATALVWTRGPRLMPLPAALTAAALAEAGAPAADP